MQEEQKLMKNLDAPKVTGIDQIPVKFLTCWLSNYCTQVSRIVDLSIKLSLFFVFTV